MSDTDKLKLVRVAISSDGELIAPASADREPPDLRPVEFSDDALAKLISADLGDDWRYAPETDESYLWDEKRFALDKKRVVFHRARLVHRKTSLNIETARLARQVSSKSTIYAAVRLASEDPRHATQLEQFDANPWLLNTPAGIVDLRSGKIRDPERSALMTRMTTAAPGGDAPNFFSFLREATGRDIDLQNFLKRIAGYCLTGSIEEHALFFVHGPGRTGKTVFTNVLLEMLGEYAMTAPMDMFTVTTGERHPADLAMLNRKRLVTASETQEGRRWDEAKLKAITGGDRITARFMRGNFFSFQPTFKLFMSGNYRPAMRSPDDAMRRRFLVIPFTHKPERIDKALPDKLRAELGGILAWAIEGELERQRIGLAPPAAVLNATAEYFEAEDAMGRWIQERCVQGPNETAITGDLYRDYKSWAERVGEYAGSERRFAQRLQIRGFGRWLHPATRQRGFQGLAPLATGRELDLVVGDRARGGGGGVHTP